jgi:hypothetical protein
MLSWCSALVLLQAASAAAGQAAPQASATPPRPEPPPARIWREPASPVQEGRIAMPVAGNLNIGVGRFSVAGQARLRSHPESLGHAAEIARGDRARAAVGLSLRF